MKVKDARYWRKNDVRRTIHVTRGPTVVSACIKDVVGHSENLANVVGHAVLSHD